MAKPWRVHAAQHASRKQLHGHACHCGVHLGAHSAASGAEDVCQKASVERPDTAHPPPHLLMLRTQRRTASRRQVYLAMCLCSAALPHHLAPRLAPRLPTANRKLLRSPTHPRCKRACLLPAGHRNSSAGLSGSHASRLIPRRSPGCRARRVPTVIGTAPHWGTRTDAHPTKRGQRIERRHQRLLRPVAPQADADEG